MKYLLILLILLLSSCYNNIDVMDRIGVPEEFLETAIIIQHSSRGRDTLIVKAASIWKNKRMWQVDGLKRSWYSDIEPIIVPRKLYSKYEIDSIVTAVDSIRRLDAKLWH